MAWDTGTATVIGATEGASYWQPWPVGGHVTIKVSPDRFPSNLYSAGIQVLPPGGAIPVHAHQRAEELLVVIAGTGRATVDGVESAVSRGSLLYAGRWVQHGFVNDSDYDLAIYFVIWPPGLDEALAAFGRRRIVGDPPPEPFAPTGDVGRQLAPARFATSHEMADESLCAQRGPCVLLEPDEGESYWQPAPTDGYATVKISPLNVWSNHVTVVEQVVPPGKVLPAHAHPRNEELKLITTGTGVATVQGREWPVEPGALCVTGRWVEHSFLNTGTDDLTILAVFMPPALEGLIAGIGRPRTPGDPAPESFPVPADIAELAAGNDLVVHQQIVAHEQQASR